MRFWRNGLELAIWLALGLTAFALTFQFSAELGSYRWGAASWPRAIIVILLVFAVAQFVLSLRLQPAEEETGERSGIWVRADHLQLLFIFALPLIYIALLPKTGFYIATPIFLIAFMRLLGERRWRYLLGVTLFIYILVNLVFTKLFYVALPTGTWPGFYDFSNWFIVLIR